MPQGERREPGARAFPERWLPWLVPVLIALVTFAAFLPALHNQFVNWDDDDNLLNNPRYRGLGWTQLRWMWTTFHMGHWIPLTWMTFGLDYLLWGMNPFGYHLSNLFLHAANAVVFYFVVFRILRLVLSDPGDRGHLELAGSAAFAALLFALHPLRVESVAWATERRDVLSGLFYLSTILVYVGTGERGERGQGRYWLSVALFGCALLSKSMSVSLPVVLLILDVYPLRRLGGARGWWGKHARRVYLEKLPFALLAAIASVIVFISANRVVASLDQLTVLGRLAISAYSLSFYLWKMVLPVNLSPLYEMLDVKPWAPRFLLSYGVVITITALTFALRHRVRGLLAAWLAYVVTLLPVLGIFQNGPQIAADRYTYLAVLGWALLAGAALLSASRRLPFLSTGLAFFLLLGLGPLTWNQIHIWHDSEKLWSHAVAIDPGSAVSQYSLGVALAQQGKLIEAMEHYQTALRINPDYADAHNNVGALLADQGKLAEASEHYQTALRLKPDHAEAHGNVGAALARQGKLAEAVAHYETALRITPDHAGVHSLLGAALARQGKLAEAIQQYQHALQIKPDFAEAHVNWGLALAQQGKLAEAIDHYRQALQSKPDYADAHHKLGNALSQQGKLTEASEHFRQAPRLKPDYADDENNLGIALARQGKLTEASERFRQALRVKPDFVDAHYNLGMALAQQGKLAEASEHYRQALRIKPDYADAHNNLGNALAQQGKLAEASDHYREALRIKPDFANAHYNWGNALAQQGKLAEASDHYRQALRLKPDYADAHSNWGNALAQQGKLAEASDHYRQALRIKPDHAAAQSNLVDALRGLGAGRQDAAPSRKGEQTE